MREMTEIEKLIAAIGESVFVYVEPRNEEHEWTVGLTHTPLIHEHWPSLRDGLVWLRDNRDNFERWRGEIDAPPTLDDARRDAADWEATARAESDGLMRHYNRAEYHLRRIEDAVDVLTGISRPMPQEERVRHAVAILTGALEATGEVERA